MMTPALIGVAVVAAALSASPALAQSAPAQQNASLVCSSGGLTYRVGEYACIPACHGARRLARCDVEGGASFQQVTWIYISDMCPSAMIINPPWPEDWNALPVQTSMSPIPVTVKMSAIDPMIAPRIGSRWEQAAVIRSITH
jgi:hypothetical protein